jgi:hypothetical protein
MYSQVSQYFAVNFDACQVQTVDETAVCQSFVIGANARIDALDPQAAEVTLAIMTVASCVLVCFIDSLCCNFERILATSIVTFGLVDDFLVTAMGDNTPFYA